MQNIPRQCPSVKSVYGYFDKLQAWLQIPATKAELDELDRHCGRGGIYAENKSARFGRRWRQRIELRQPSDMALRWIADRDDALINRAEMAVDIAFDNPADRDDARYWLDHHIVRRWHRETQLRCAVRRSRMGGGSL